MNVDRSRGLARKPSTLRLVITTQRLNQRGNILIPCQIVGKGIVQSRQRCGRRIDSKYARQPTSDICIRVAELVSFIEDFGTIVFNPKNTRQGTSAGEF